MRPGVAINKVVHAGASDWTMRQTESSAVDKAIAELWLRHVFRKEDRGLEVRAVKQPPILSTCADWRRGMASAAWTPNTAFALANISVPSVGRLFAD